MTTARTAAIDGNLKSSNDNDPGCSSLRPGPALTRTSSNDGWEMTVPNHDYDRPTDCNPYGAWWKWGGKVKPVNCIATDGTFPGSKFEDCCSSIQFTKSTDCDPAWCPYTKGCDTSQNTKQYCSNTDNIGAGAISDASGVGSCQDICNRLNWPDWCSDTMADWCSQKVTTCMPYPTPAVGSTTVPFDLNGCSRFMSTGDDGRLCRSWAANDKTKNVAEAAMIQYCAAHNTLDCQCINRANNTIYQMLSNQTTPTGQKSGPPPFPPHCYFIPCSNSNQFLVTSADKTGECPANYCAQINNIKVDNDSSFIAEWNQSINCSPPTSTPTPSPNPDPTPTPTPSPVPETPKLFDLFVKWIQTKPTILYSAIGILSLLFILLIMWAR